MRGTRYGRALYLCKEECYFAGYMFAVTAFLIQNALSGLFVTSE